MWRCQWRQSFPARYNIAAGLITQLVTNVAGIDYVTNQEGWITREGSDDEEDETLRSRAIGKWSQLSVGGGRDAYIAWAQEIPGAVAVQVDDEHPRGQGTIDVIITGTVGLPTPELIAEVQTHIDQRRPLCADVLVIGPEPVVIDFDVVLHVHPEHGDLAEIKTKAEETLMQCSAM